MIAKSKVYQALAIAGAALFLTACDPAESSDQAATAPTEQDARAFVERAEQELAEMSVHAARTAWVGANFITEDTQALSAKSGEEYTTLAVSLANEAKRFNDLDLPYDLDRKLEKIKQQLTLAAPADAAKTKELATITTNLEADYGKGKYCKADGSCRTLGELSEVLRTSRDPDELLDAWVGWRTISKKMRAPYQRMVELANEGANELGYADTGAMWRSKYDMPADEFSGELDRLWGQVKPLYEALHCHVRANLNEEYGAEVAPASGPIPAHLLGNMWSQSWGNVYEMVAPENADPGYDLTKILKEKGYDAKKMVETAENFFVSLGFEPLPDTFWTRSLFTKPRDRDVVCHASAWNIDNVDDLRIKMCTEVNSEDFQTVHHELGHNFYQRAYNQQPHLYKESANDGFHEAIGDTIALSMTPRYLVDLGLIDEQPAADKDIGLLLKQALDKIAFLPFGLMVDQWRWQVFNGEISPEEYNAGWWKLREKYQGIKPPVARSEEDFDPGAKFHIPGNTPYSRYFLAHILQFQFHRDLCEIAGNKDPLNRCSIYGNKEAGERLNQMLEMGSSKPWQEALEAMTGSREMDATAILDYFAPLKTWLDEQNQNRQCGW